jgi:secondary thiamine-phosphate synthase enzyme
MKIISKKIKIQTKELFQFVELVDLINKEIKKSKIENGFCLIRILHTTAALVVTERDPAVHKDFIRNLKRMLPESQDWNHSYEGSINARAHQATAWLGSTHWAPIKDNKLSLGTWQGIFFVELFEPRSREVEIIIVGQN